MSACQQLLSIQHPFVKSGKGTLLTNNPALLRNKAGLLSNTGRLFENANLTTGTVPIVRFFLKIIAKMFGGFKNFLYLCSIIIKAGMGHPM